MMAYGRLKPPYFCRFEVNRVHEVCFDPFAQLHTVETLDSRLHCSLSFQRKHFFSSLKQVSWLLLYGAQSEYQSFVCRRALSRRLSVTHLILGRISGGNVPCCEVVEGTVHSKYRMEIVTCGSESKPMHFRQRE